MEEVTVNTTNGTTWFKVRRVLGATVFLTIGLVGLPLTAQGQDSGATLLSQMTPRAIGPPTFEGHRDARTFGTSDVIHTVTGVAFTSLGEGHEWVTDPEFGSRYCAGTNNSCTLLAPVHLPAGARITAIQVDAWDTSLSSFLEVDLMESRVGESFKQKLVTISTDGLGAPGHLLIGKFLLNFHTVDNLNSMYFLRYAVIGISGEGGNPVRLQAVRVVYNLQVSPAPAVATFNDVPTDHPFFPVIEALVAAGITTGCGNSPPLFCPDGPVTRKQMAAFLARALGLHWAP